MNNTPRDHGGGLDGAAARFGGAREDWIDLSTGINPVPYDIGAFSAQDWTALPDAAALDALSRAARKFWNVPKGAAILPAPGASALIARIPALVHGTRVDIPAPTYNEHAAAFLAQGWEVSNQKPNARVLVHPNNPDGRMWRESDVTAPLTVIDESFCDIAPDESLIHLADRTGVIVLKSFGKFWGLAGLRLGFAIGDPALLARLNDFIGPWAVSGPALKIGARALHDDAWATQTRTRLGADALRLDSLMKTHGASIVGGTTLFRLYDVGDAALWQDKLARTHIWSRVFPYSTRWLRLGLPAPTQWARLSAALSGTK
ncbi:MAG: threonine-phosphate decarboxylase [Planktotalea sp.]|uniref:threonine-phosphate decarboxylase n=1 Tax=Planktotalea sp. TaxID=2029877 RepID=UPI003C77809A